MTKRELNRDIKRLASEIYRMSFEDANKYFTYIEREAKREYLRLYDDDDTFENMNRQSILIMMVLNRMHKFKAQRHFGLRISLKFLC